jgi:signal transduction histidine kinase
VEFEVTNESHGLGIVGIQERVNDLGGYVRITSEALRGTVLLVEIPLQARS